MKYYIVWDFGTKVAAESRKDVGKALGYSSNRAMAKDNGYVMPDIDEITEEQYDAEDGYDVA